MPAGRLLGSYVVRVVVRNGVRSVLVHDIASASTEVLPDFGALAAHLERLSSSPRASPGAASPLGEAVGEE